MGYRMAGHLLRAGHDVALWSHTAGKAEALAKEGKGTVCATPREAAERADFIFLCVGDTAMVEEVCLGANGLIQSIRKGAVVSDCSSIAPDASVEIGKAFTAAGAHFLDAPVTGSTGGATNASLTFMVGGEQAAYDRAKLMSVDYDGTELGIEADERIRTFQRDAAAQAGIFHHLITLPTYHTAALSTDNLAKRYFGEEGMLGYVKQVQREEIRQGIACVKHQNMAGSDIGDDHKEYFAGEAALKAGGAHNTMNQFS